MTSSPPTRRTVLKSMFAGGAVAAVPATLLAGGAGAPGAMSAAAAGIVGDGRTPVAGAIQRLLDQMAAAGGGTLVLPPGVYILEKTILMPSRTHLVGHGAATVLRGGRPDGVNGFALVANAGITSAAGYSGAGQFSIQHLAIDSPRTNGLVLVHASDVLIAHIHGLDAFHHHIDIAGSRNVFTAHLYLTGRSGTAPYQVDGNPFNNNIWDGSANIPPFIDDTVNDGLFLSDSVIRPTNRSNHGIHLHRRAGRNLFFDNVLIEHLENGIYRDPNCSREDAFFSNITIRDVSRRAVMFRNSRRRDSRIAFRNITIADCGEDTVWECHAMDGLRMEGIEIDAAGGNAHVLLDGIDRFDLAGLTLTGSGTGTAVHLRNCRNGFVSRLLTRDLPDTLRLEGCTNIAASNLLATDRTGNATEPTVTGDGLVPASPR